MWFTLIHWGRLTHISVSKLTITGSDNGLSPGRRQAIIWTNIGILLIRPLGTNLNEILIEIHTFSLKKMHLKNSSGKWRPSCPRLNVLSIFIMDSAVICIYQMDIANNITTICKTCRCCWQIIHLSMPQVDSKLMSYIKSKDNENIWWPWTIYLFLIVFFLIFVSFRYDEIVFLTAIIA